MHVYVCVCVRAVVGTILSVRPVVCRDVRYAMTSSGAYCLSDVTVLLTSLPAVRDAGHANSERVVSGPTKLVDVAVIFPEGLKTHNFDARDHLKILH